ncbi:XrtA/PEP-CTERM system TPR-repeat protein PrsT [Thalassotalea piscium]
MAVNIQLKKIALLSLLLCSQTSLAYTEQATNQPYEEALKSFYGSDLNTAIIHLKNALKSHPNHLPSLLLLAEVYIARGDGAAAEDSLLRARQYNADEKKILPLLLEAYLLQQKYKLVINNANTNFSDNQLQSDILVLKGRAHVEMNEFAQAKIAYQQALDYTDSNIQAKLGMAQVHLLKYQYPQARAFLESVLSISSINANALVMLASIEQNEGNIKEALTIISQVIALNSENFPALLTRASLYLEQNKFELALADLNVILAKIPNEPKANYLKVVASSGLGDLSTSKETIEHLNIVLSGLPSDVMKQNPVYLYLAGVVSYQQEEYRKAQDVLNRYIDIIDEDPRALKLLARTEIALGQLLTAKTYLIKARLIAPDDVETWSLLGNTLLSLGEIEKAQQYFLDVITAEADRAEPLYDLAKLQVLTGQNKSAIENLLKAKTITTNEDILLLLASAYKNDSQFNAALTTVNQLITIDPNSSYYYQQQGVLLGLLGEHAKAKSALNTSAKLNADNLETLIHLARIDVIEGNVEKAISRIKTKIEEQQTPSLLLLIELGSLYQNIGDLDNATVYLEKAYSQNRDDFNAIREVLTLYVVKGDIDKAITTANEYLSRNNKAGDIYLALANMYMSVKDYKKADHTYVLAIKNSNNKSHVYGIYADAQLKMNNLDGAILSLQRSISWNEENLEHYLTLFDVYLKSDKEILAKKLLESLKAKTDNKALIERLTGDLYRFANSFELANTHYQLSMKENITRPAVFGLYRVYQQQQRFDEAITLLNSWLAIAKDDLVAHIAIADMYKANQKIEKAALYYQDLVKQYGEMPVLLNNLAQLQIKLNQYPLAQVNAEKAYKSLPNNNAVIDTLAWTYSLTEQYQEALPLYRQALSKDSSNAEIKYHLAYTLVKLERLAEAKNLLNEVVNSNQMFEGMEAAKALLTSL